MLTARLEKLGLKPGAWVLDLGCGEGRHVHGLHVLGGINVVGLDRDGPSLVKAREGLAMLPAATATTGFVEGDAYRTPYADATFDAVICSEVLEHLEDYHAALAEIARVLKPGGVFVATVPRAWPERICWALASGPGGYGDQPGGHVRIFDERELAADIAKGGFDRTGRHHAHGLHAGPLRPEQRDQDTHVERNAQQIVGVCVEQQRHKRNRRAANRQPAPPRRRDHNTEETQPRSNQQQPACQPQQPAQHAKARR